MIRCLWSNCFQNGRDDEHVHGQMGFKKVVDEQNTRPSVVSQMEIRPTFSTNALTPILEDDN